jgi:hypothetical protein
LKDTEDAPVTLYKSMDGVFYPLAANLSDTAALDALEDYSRVLAVFRHRSDIFSGIYVHNKKSKNLDIHLRGALHNGIL